MSAVLPPSPALSAADKRRLLAELLAKKQQQAAAAVRHPLTAAQRRLWFIEQLSPGLAAYHIPAALQLDGPLDGHVLARALDGALARHDVLRARFVDEAGEPWMQIAPAAPLGLAAERMDAFGDDARDAAGAPLSADQQAEAQAALRALVTPHFDLRHGPLLRARLLQAAPQRHVLLLCVHHLVADHASLRILLRDIAALYAALPLPPLTLQYTDYAAWQSAREQAMADEREWWLRQLADAPPDLPLPTDRPRPPVQRGRGARFTFTLPAGLSDALRGFARQSQASLFATMLAGLQALLARCSGQHDVWVGTLVSQRERPETRPLVGLFVNNLVLRTRIEPKAPFAALVADVRQTVLGALAHQTLPFEQVVDALRTERRLDRHPLFQVSFVLHEGDGAPVQLPGLRIAALAADAGTTRFDLALDVNDTGGALHTAWEYDADLFDAATIERMARQYRTLLAAAVAQPQVPLAALDLMDDDARRSIAAWNATERALPDTDVFGLFLQQVQARPDALAVTAGGRTWDYAALARRVATIAARLDAEGLRRGDIAGIALPRGADLPAALLACLSRGVAYVPLDPQQPPARLAGLLDAAGAACVLVSAPEASLASALGFRLIDLSRQDDAASPAEENTAPAAPAQPPDTLAYLIFTSGTTGQPKGVPITQRSLLNLLCAMAEVPGIAAGDTLVAVTTISFDIAALELLLPLAAGARVVIADRDTAADGAALGRLLDAEEATHLQATPAGWRLLLEAGWAGRPGLTMLCGGEALDAALAQRLLATGGTLWNVYGPTETTIWSAALRLSPALLAGGTVPIGGAIANTTLDVLDDAGRPLPPGLAGELAIGGLGLSPGYWRQPALTRERFVPAVANGTSPGPLLYRTGDRVRRRADGLFDFLGRTDHQIKLRGFRIEPGEIEAALCAHPQVAQALVLLHGPAQGEPLLTAYVVARTATDPAAPHVDAATLRAHLAPRLPGYMLPAAWVLLPAFPLSANGKIDRKALPAPDAGPAAPAVVAVRRPEGLTERRLAEVWAALLGRPVHDRDADFFALGGHSLLAARLMARLPDAFGCHLPLRALFERPTLAGLAGRIDAAIAADAGPLAGTAPVQTTAAASQPTVITPLPADAAPPLSPAQQRLWVMAQLEPGNPFYNIAAAVHLPGPLPRSVLDARLAALAQRHDNLRSRFPAQDGQARLVIEPRVDVHVELLAPAPGQTVDELIAAEARRPFDLASAPLWRVAAVRDEVDGTEGHRVLVVMHHILGDAWSLGLLVQALADDAGTVAPLPPPLPLQYADFAAWQRAQDHADALGWWRTHLAGAPALLDLPTDFARPARQRLDGASLRFEIDPATRDALQALARAEGATLYMLLLAAFKLLLSRYAGSTDVVVGTPVGHRPDPRLDEVIGLFANTLALRTRLDGCTHFGELIARVRQTVLDGFAHQQVPFEQVVEALDVPRHWRHAPVFQAMLLWQPAAPAGTPRRPWTPQPVDLGVTRFDLTLALADQADGAAGLAGRLEYRTDLFLPGSMAAMAEAFGELLRQIARAPRQPLATLPMLPRRQRLQIEAWNAATARPHNRGATLPALVLAQAVRTPDAPALTCGDQTLSYRELVARSTTMAARLRALGAGPEQRVGVCLPRRTELVVSLLAVLQAGAAYVPLDPSYPAERIAFIAADAQLRVLLAPAGHGIAGLDAGVAVLDPSAFSTVAADAAPLAYASAGPRPDHLAYLIYTSGSTGRPKGVAIEHRQAVAMVHWALATFSPAQLAGVLAATSVCFDLSVYELFVPLAGGGCVILADDVLALPTLPAAARVTLINTVPTACAELLRLGTLPAGIHTVNLAGEPIPPALVGALYAQPGVEGVYNLYGPSEDTTYSTGMRLPREITGPVTPIGAPIANSQAWVLDDTMQPVPIGMPGELYLGGEGVARGYWQRPALTAERFVPDPFTAAAAPPRTATLYRTGDRVRQRPDGVLDYLGRIDQQVKIRGFRIELGEVEAALCAHPGVRQAVATAHRDARGHQRLVAYVVAADGASPSDRAALPGVLRRQLRERLPEFMVPSAIVPLAALPVLPNGKLDRQALPDPLAAANAGAEATAPGSDATPADAPGTDAERRLATVWAGVLGRAPAGRDAHFFESGGDSILAIQLVARAREANLPLAPRDVFLHPQLSALAAQAEARQAEGTTATAPRGPATGLQPLTPAQAWFFELGLEYPAHWNQSVMLRLPAPIEARRLAQATAALAAHHDVLRARFERAPDGWRQTFDAVDAQADAGNETRSDTDRDARTDADGHAEPDAPQPAPARDAESRFGRSPLLHLHRRVADAAAARAEIEALAQAAQASLDLARGPLWRIVAMQVDHPGGSEHRLLFVAHHLLVDGVSWRILLGDLQALLRPGTDAPMPAPTALPRTSPAADWAQALHQPGRFDAERAYWHTQARAEAEPWPIDHAGGSNRMRDHATVTVTLDEALTRQWLEAVPAAARLRPEELLLAALLLAVRQQMGPGPRRLMLEGHGRGELDSAPLDLGRTVGWFTALHPLRLDIGAAADDGTGLDHALKQVKAALRAVPQHGLGWSVLRQAGGDDAQALQVAPGLRFNYLGQSDGLFSRAENPPFAPADERTGAARHPDDEREVLLDFNALVARGRLQLHGGYSRALHRPERIEALMAAWRDALAALVAHSLSDRTDGSHVPADFPLMDLSADALDDLLDTL
ncbi:amino acid adenylation domain-containing protein [Aquincola sp. MAHUQ-54]|uniref:Amino acid adenylation domain-containing protein n=1 Tax=Aquincola agrisoli TaxID=3119538 RepID=A0AAW9Q7F4_9BURK